MNYYSRKFLNKNKGMAAVEISATIENGWFDSGVAINDCNRKVSLDFTSLDKKTFIENQAKLSLLISELMVLSTLMEDFKESPEFSKIDKKRKSRAYFQ